MKRIEIRKCLNLTWCWAFLIRSFGNVLLDLTSVCKIQIKCPQKSVYWKQHYTVNVPSFPLYRKLTLYSVLHFEGGKSLLFFIILRVSTACVKCIHEIPIVKYACAKGSYSAQNIETDPLVFSLKANSLIVQDRSS